MKKFFLFAAAAVAALSVNAKTWEFKADTISTVEAVKAFCSSEATFKLEQKTSSDQKPYVAVNYDLAGADAVLDLDKAPVALKFTYKNSGSKNEVLKFYSSYLQIARKGTIMTIACKSGDEIKIYPKSYSKACEFAVTGADKTTVAIEKDSEAVITLKASASEVVFDTSTPSDADKYAQACQIVKIEVGGDDQAIENVEAEVKSVKTFENGQLVIIKNGVKYNALGAQL